MPRIELRDGQWADVREHITHGQRKAIIRAVQVDDLELMATMNRAYVEAWEIRGIDGVFIPVDAPDAFDRIPDDVAQEIYAVVLKRWQSVTDTVPTPPSSDA
jgi:DNA-binding cell septation regulator SpoVG